MIDVHEEKTYTEKKKYFFIGYRTIVYKTCEEISVG